MKASGKQGKPGKPAGGKPASKVAFTTKPPRRWLKILGRIFEAGVFVLAMGALILMCSIPSTSRLATQNPTSTAFIDLRREQAAAEGKKFDLKFEWRPLGKISRYLRAAVVYSEDWRFYDHDGVDWEAIEHAIHANIGEGAMAIGGSTITQQLAKNLYLSPNRSLLRKLRELLIAFSLEDHLSKTRILELYLNICEWGDGVFGAEAASQYWFHHSAQTLTPAEAVRLAIALPNPYTRAPNVRSKELTKKSVRLIRLLRIQGLLNTEQERVALDSVGAAKTPVIAKTKQLQDIDDDVPDGEGPDTPPTIPSGTTSAPPSEPAPVTKPDHAPDPMPPQEPRRRASRERESEQRKPSAMKRVVKYVLVLAAYRHELAEPTGQRVGVADDESPLPGDVPPKDPDPPAIRCRRPVGPRRSSTKRVSSTR